MDKKIRRMTLYVVILVIIFVTMVGIFTNQTAKTLILLNIGFGIGYFLLGGPIVKRLNAKYLK